MAGGGAPGGGVQVVFTIAANTAAALAQLKAFQKSLTDLASVMPKLASSSAGFSTAVGNITASSKTLAATMKSVFTAINTFTGALSKTQAALAKMASNSATINKSFGSINKSLQNLQKSAANTSSALASAGKKSTTAANNFAKLGTALSPVTKAVQGLRASLQTLEGRTVSASKNVDLLNASTRALASANVFAAKDINATIGSLAKLQSQVQNLGKAAQTFTMFGGAARSANTNINNTSVSIKNMGGVAGSVFNSTRNAVQNMLGPLTRLGAVAFTINMLAFSMRLLANSAKTLASFFLEATAQIQDANVVYKVLLGTTVAAIQRLEELQKINVKSPFDLPDLIQADRMLEVAGVRSREFLENILNAALVTRPAFRTLQAQLNQVSLAISRVAAKNYGYAFRRLRELQVATQPMLEGEGLKFDRSGHYLGTVDQALKGLNNIFAKRYAQAAEMATQTLHGQLSNFRDQITILRVIGGEPLGEAVLGELKNLITFLQSPATKQAAAKFGVFLAEGFKAAVAAFHAAKNAIGDAVAGIMGFLHSVTGGTTQFVAATITAFKPLSMAISALFSGDLTKAAAYARVFLTNLAVLFLHAIRGLARQMGIGGTNVIASFASGLIRGAGTAVAAAIRFITRLIESFLKGSSPPKQGPLSTIDTWFGKVIDAYLAGWDQADWSILNDITSRIADAFQTLVDQGQMSIQEAINAVTGQGGGVGLNQLIAQAINAIAETGKQDQDALLKIQALLGKKNEDLFKEIKTRLDSAVLGKQIRELQKQLELVNDTAEMQAIEQSISDAQELIKNARTARGQRAGQEQLAASTSAQKQREKQAALLERQIKLMETQQGLLDGQVSAYEAIGKLRETEEKFLQHMLDLQKTEADEIQKRADAEWDYNFSLADSTKKLEMLRAKLKTVEKGSTDYWDILKQIHDLEQQRADAQWDFDFAMADSAKQIDTLREKQAKYAKGSVEWIALEQQINGLLNDQQEAQDKINFAQQDTIQQLATLKQRQSQYTKGSKEWLDLEAQIIDATEALADAQWQYDFAAADSATKLNLLQQKQSQYTKGSKEWLDVQKQIDDLNQQRLDLERQIAFAQADSAQKIAMLQEQQKQYTEGSIEYLNIQKEINDLTKSQVDAEWNLAFAKADTATQIQMINEKIAATTAGSAEYYALSGQLYDLEKQRADETARRADAELQYQLAIANSTEKRALLEDRLSKLNPDDPAQVAEYFQIKTQLAALDKERNDAEEQYNFELADSAGKLDILQKKLAGLPPQSAEWYAVQLQIRQLQNDQADKDRKDEEARLKAEQDYQMSLLDTEGQISLLIDQRNKLKKGSTEYYEIQGRIHDLEGTATEETRALAQAALDLAFKKLEPQDQMDTLVEREAEMRRRGLDHTLAYYDLLGQIFDLEKQNGELEPVAGMAKGIKGTGSAYQGFIDNALTPIQKALRDAKADVDRFIKSLTDGEGPLAAMRAEFDKLKNNPAVVTIKDMAVAFDDLGKTIKTHGKDILAILIALTVAMKSFAILSIIIGPLDAVTSGIMKMTVASKGGATGMNIFKGALFGLIGFLGGPATLIIAGIAALIGIFALVWIKNLGGIREKSAAFFTFIKPLLTSLGKAFGSLGTALVKLFTALKPVFIAIAFVIGGVFAAALPMFVVWLTAMIDTIALLVDGVATFIDILFEIGTTLVKIVDIFIHGGSLQEIDVAWAKLGDDIVNTIGLWVTDATKIVTDFLDGILGLFGTNTDEILKVAGKFVDDMIAWWKDLFDRSVKWFNDTWDAIVGIFTSLWEKLVGHSVIPDIVNDILDWFGKLPGAVLKIAKDVWKNIVDKFTDLKNDALDLFVKLVGRERAGGILQSIYDLKESLIGPRGLITVLIGARNLGGIVGLFWGMVDLVTGKEGAAGKLEEMLSNSWTAIQTSIIGPSGLLTILIGSRESKTGIVGLFWSIFDTVVSVFGSGDGDNNTVRGFIAGAWNGVIAFINSLAHNTRAAFLDPIKAVVTGMADFMLGFAKVIQRGFQQAMAVIKSFAKAFVDAINVVSNWLTGKDAIKWEGGTIKVDVEEPAKPKLPDLPAYAKGTGYHPGGYAVVGDDGPEVLKLPLGSRVVPKNLAGRFLKGASGLQSVDTGVPYDSSNPETTPAGFDPIEYFLAQAGEGIRKAVSRIKMGAVGMLESVLGISDLVLPGAMGSWGGKIFEVVKDMAVDKVGGFVRTWITDHLPGWVANWLFGKTNLESGGSRFANDARGAPGEGDVPGADVPVIVSPEGYVFPIRGFHGTIAPHWQNKTYPGYRGAADLFGAPGADILAMHGGKVTYSGFDATGGNAVFIVGSDGLQYYYAHMKEHPFVQVGQDVKAGTLLGHLWNTGNASATEKHLHIGIGHTIATGSGPMGGAAPPVDSTNQSTFDATSLLQQVYNFTITVPAQPQTGDNYGQPWWGSRSIGAATNQVTQWVKGALGVGGFPPDWITAMTMLVMGESGGSQYAINLNDVNKDHPSRGIAQVIPDTYNAFKRTIARAFTGAQGWGGFDYEHSDAVGDIYDPLENLMAALGWILRGKKLSSPNQLQGYLSGISGGPWVGYASGGIIKEPIVGRGLRTGTNYTFGEVGPELILPINEQLANLIKGIAVGTHMGPQAMWQNTVQMGQPLTGSMQDFSALLAPYAPTITVQGAGMGPDEAAAVMKRVLADDRQQFYAEAARRIKNRKTGR